MIKRNNSLSKQDIKNMKDKIFKIFFYPLEIEIIQNLDNLLNCKHTKKETYSLFCQTNNFLKNIFNLLNNNQFIEANILLRSAYETLMMGFLINYDKDIYNEYKKALEIFYPNYTSSYNLRKQFSKHLKSNNNLIKLLNKFYSKGSKFTHPTLQITLIHEIKKNNDEDIIKNYYFINAFTINILLHLCLNKVLNLPQNSNFYISYISYCSLLIYELPEYKLKNQYLKKYNDILKPYNKNINVQNFILDINKIYNQTQILLKTKDFNVSYLFNIL